MGISQPILKNERTWFKEFRRFSINSFPLKRERLNVFWTPESRPTMIDMTTVSVTIDRPSSNPSSTKGEPLLEKRLRKNFPP
jgi:hypothetical protein